VDTIDKIFKNKNPNDIFILSNGHAALALYVVLEKYYGHDAEELFKKHGGHPHFDEENHIHCSTGSLGMGLSTAVGRALVNQNRNVYVMISDGECAEGVVWESLYYMDISKIKNIKLYVMANGYGAYKEIDINDITSRIINFTRNLSSNVYIVDVRQLAENFPFLHDLNAHYHIMKENDYKLAMELTE
jgi:transketolase